MVQRHDRRLGRKVVAVDGDRGEIPADRLFGAAALASGFVGAAVGRRLWRAHLHRLLTRPESER